MFQSVRGRRRQPRVEHSLQAPSLPQLSGPAIQPTNNPPVEAKQMSRARISPSTQNGHGPQHNPNLTVQRHSVGQYEKPSSLTITCCLLFFLPPLAPLSSSLLQLLLHYICTKKIQILSSKTWRSKLQLLLWLLFLPGRAAPGIPAPQSCDKSTKILRRWKAVRSSAKCTCEQRWKQLPASLFSFRKEEHQAAAQVPVQTGSDHSITPHRPNWWSLRRACIARRRRNPWATATEAALNWKEAPAVLSERRCTPVTAQFGADAAEFSAAGARLGCLCTAPRASRAGTPQPLGSLKWCCRE